MKRYEPTMLEALLTRALDRPESILVVLETASDLLRTSCDKFLALFILEDTGFVRCVSNFVLRILKETESISRSLKYNL